MAAPLPRVTLNLQPGLVAGVQPPAQPENPPNPADVEGAMELMAELPPFAGAALVFNAITALSLRLDSLQREMAINGNMGKGTGIQIPYSEVLFVDGSLPSVAAPARPPLPILGNVNDIRNLTAAQAGCYLTGHGVPLPEGAAAQRRRVAQCVGCLLEL